MVEEYDQLTNQQKLQFSVSLLDLGEFVVGFVVWPLEEEGLSMKLLANMMKI